MTSSEEMLAALRVRYPKSGYAFLTNVSNGTGARANRFADAIIMSLWPSRGLEIIGVEIKVSRSDWLRELQQPEKADPLFAYCDCWYLAVSDRTIIHPGELPRGWGLLAPAKEDKLACVTAAVPQKKPKFDREFLAAVLRRVTEQISPEALMEKAGRDCFERGAKHGVEQQMAATQHVQDQLQKLRDEVWQFQKASGVIITNQWNLGDIGAAVASVRTGAYTNGLRRLERLANDARQLAVDLEEAWAKQRATIVSDAPEDYAI
jgi:hypothetical protein